MKKKIQYNSPVILTFAVISFVALVLRFLTGGVTNRIIFSVYRSSLLNPLTYIRLFTHVLGHANLSHFMNNMMFFLLLGPGIEEKYGSKMTLTIIMVTAGITGILSCLLFPKVALLGASGIVFCFIVLSSITSVEEGKIPLTLILVCILYIGQEVINAVFSKDDVSQFAHILGGICGCLFGFAAGGRKKKSR